MYRNQTEHPSPGDKVVYVGVPPETIPSFPLIRNNYLYCISESRQISGRWFVRLTGLSIRINEKENCWMPSSDFRLVSGSSHSDHSSR